MAERSDLKSRPAHSLLTALRDAPWLDADRARAWVRILATVSLAAALFLTLVTHAGRTPDLWGRPLGSDFSSFWTAARLAVTGHPAAPWIPADHETAERENFPPGAGFADGYTAFFYPPPFLLICLPLGLLPYSLALAVWLAVTGAACLAVLRALLPPSWPALLISVAYPAVLVNADHGQNGALSTALAGAAALSLDRRPILGGACLGALCYKPQLALLVLPALVMARRWHALAAAAASTVGLCLASLLVLGRAAWSAFLRDSHLATSTMEFGLVGFAKMASVFAGLRLLGAPTALAWGAQGVVSILALAAMMFVARKRPGGGAECATLATAACLATPFLLDYDLMLLAVPLAWLASQAERTQWRAWEKLTLAATFLLALVARPLALALDLPVAPLVVAGLLAALVRRNIIGKPVLC